MVIGGFWSMSAATAMRLVPVDQVPRALAIFGRRHAVATVVAAPLGSYLGAVIGWRGAFLCLLPVAALALGWQWISLPSMSAERVAPHVSVFALFKRRVVALGMAACGVFFMGQFALFTYVRPFLETVAHVDAPALALVLLGIGVAGFVGTVAIGAFLKRGLYRSLIAIPILMAVVALRPGFLRRAAVARGHIAGVVGAVRHPRHRSVGGAGSRRPSPTTTQKQAAA